VTKITVAFRIFSKALEKGKTKGKRARWNVNNTEGKKKENILVCRATPLETL